MNAQSTFHNIYFFDDSIAVIHNIHSTDSCYFIAATEYNKSNQRFEPIFGKLTLTGDIDWYVRNEDSNYNQQTYAYRTELKPNNQGNFTFGYVNGAQVRMLNYSPSGVLVRDTTYSQLLSVDSLLFLPYGQILTEDSCYYAYFSYYDELNDFDIWQYDGETGVWLAKISLDGDILWEKRIANPLSTMLKPQMTVTNCQLINDSTLILINREGDNGLSEPDIWYKLHMNIIDTSGNTISHFERQDTQQNFGWPGMFVSDNIIIYSNFISNYTTTGGGSQPNWNFTPVITAIDSANNFLWKDTLCYTFTIENSHYLPNKYVKITDTTFAGAFTFFDFVTNEDTSEFYTLYNIEFFNKDIETGENVWERHYRYFPEDSMSRHEHQIIDIERTYDDGYIMSGSVYSMDSSQAGRPHTYGYIIKTNCLGFLGSPQASFSYSFNENDELILTNSSTQAGSYQWNFGDNSSLMTGENETSISHSYSTNGQYEVELIAYGCDNNNDTAQVTIDVEMKDPGFAGDGSLLTLFPNPTKTGQSTGFYIGKINGETTIQVVNSAGQLVSSFRIPAGETTYLFPCSYSAGTYFFQLTQGSAILEVEKLVVE